MSATLLEGGLDVRIDRGRDAVVIRFSGSLVLRTAPEARRLLADELEITGSRVIVDLGGVDDLDTAGIAAVTSPSFTALRRGHDVAVLPPVAGDARLVADRIGVFPISLA